MGPRFIVSIFSEVKLLIENKLPGCKVIIVCPTYRYDEPKAKLTIIHLQRKLNKLKMDVILNDNITDKHIGKKGLHLNGAGSGRFAMNFMSNIVTILAY